MVADRAYLFSARHTSHIYKPRCSSVNRATLAEASREFVSDRELSCLITNYTNGFVTGSVH